MFEDLLNQMKHLERGIQVPINLPTDDDGYFDRLCPACSSEFKVYFEHWVDKVREEAAYCPICCAEAPATEWNTSEQRKTIESQALRYAHRELTRAMDRGVRRFNAKQPRRGFISMKLSHRPTAPPIVMPIDAAATMRRKFECETCGCRYASVGAAFFCPACGHNSARTMFATSIEHVRAVIDKLPRIRTALGDAQDADFAEDTIRRLRRTRSKTL